MAIIAHRLRARVFIYQARFARNFHYKTMGNANQKRFEKQYSIFVQENEVKNPAMKSFTIEAWKSLVLKDLHTIESSKIGNLLLRSIGYWGMPVWIEPLLAAKPQELCDSKTEPPAMTGPEIFYSPMSIGAGTFCGNHDVSLGGYLNLSYETLFHEMVHALRWASGKNNKQVSPGKGLSFYGDKEEFIAVLVQGIWASELKRPIRASHTGHFTIDEALKGSFNFFASGTDTYRYVKEFCTENVGFTTALSQVNVSFNPVRAYYYKPALAKEISHKSPLAKNRDVMMPVVRATKQYIRDQLDDLSVWMDNLGKPPTGPSTPIPHYKP